MSTRTHSRIHSKQWEGSRWVWALIVLIGAGYAAGLVGTVWMWPVWNGLVLALALGLLGAMSFRRRRRGGSKAVMTIPEEGILAVVAVFVAARWLGGMGVEIYAAVFLVLAWVVCTSSGRTALVTLSAAMVLEGASHWLGTAPAVAGIGPSPVESWMAIDWAVLAVRWGLMVAFALSSWALVGRYSEERHQKWEQEVARERRRLLEEAREFRLIHAGRSESPVDRKEAQELIVRDAVQAVHQTIFVTLELVKTALKAHTVVLLWFDVRNETLRIKELISDSDEIVEGRIDPAGGVIGGITRRRDTVKLSELRPDFRGLAYYRTPPGVSAFVGVPVIENGHLRGVLCVDRVVESAFGDEEVRIVEEAASYVMRAVENERMVASIEKTRFEVGRFYEASRQLNGVLTPQEVYEVALDSARQITDYDFAAITLYDDERDHHRVVCVDGDAAKARGDWEEVEFESNQGLVSMVVANRHYLPVGGRLRQGRTPVLTKKEDFSALDSLLVMPLIAQDKAMGTMIVADESPGAFPTERREMLEVVANQVAVTMENARLYSQMEAMAKYDALTGLANRRTFEKKLAEAMARHKRAGRTFSLVICDIDHFKSVNDTYGHPVGDEVLRQVGATFTEQMREIDIPARYGGEEFVMILEDTDIEGARLVANRLREAISELEFHTEQGLLQCTISMGIAVGPWDSDEPHILVDLADQALYHSKENGRNQVSVYREVVASGQAA